MVEQLIERYLKLNGFVASDGYNDKDDMEIVAAARAERGDLLAACESALAWLCNVNVSDPATVGRQLIAALAKAGVDKQRLNDAAVALVGGACSCPSLLEEDDCGEDEMATLFCPSCSMQVLVKAVPMAAVESWFLAAPPAIRAWMAGVVFTRFCRERHNASFQMPGKYDGAVSEEVRELFRQEHAAIGELLAAIKTHGEAK